MDVSCVTLLPRGMEHDGGGKRVLGTDLRKILTEKGTYVREENDARRTKNNDW